MKMNQEGALTDAIPSTFADWYISGVLDKLPANEKQVFVDYVAATMKLWSPKSYDDCVTGRLEELRLLKVFLDRNAEIVSYERCFAEAQSTLKQKKEEYRVRPNSIGGV